jgi:hypothetical protein
VPEAQLGCRGEALQAVTVTCMGLVNYVCTSKDM